MAHELETVLAYFTQHAAIMLAAVGVLAAVTSVITQVIKELPPLDKIKTSWVVVVISLVLSNIALAALVLLAGLVYTWYYAVAGVVVGFIVGYIAMFGWEQFSSLWRSLTRKNDTEVDNSIQH